MFAKASGSGKKNGLLSPASVDNACNEARKAIMDRKCMLSQRSNHGMVNVGGVCESLSMR